ncbi:MAG: hypothetical protein QME66_02890 [Candidatus Eisenbacteria bacterium]|nr:hypothetical protein [Candidatus Eisenbacteria bacterium]
MKERDCKISLQANSLSCFELTCPGKQTGKVYKNSLKSGGKKTVPERLKTG